MNGTHHRLWNYIQPTASKRDKKYDGCNKTSLSLHKKKYINCQLSVINSINKPRCLIKTPKQVFLYGRVVSF